MTSGDLVITGARGYVGSRLARHFAAEARVVGIDRPADDAANDPFTVIEADLSLETPTIDGVANPTIIHAAAIMKADTDAGFWRGNVATTYHAMQSAIDLDARHFIHFSTGGVYPYAFDTRHGEADEVDPIGVYGHTKWISECMVRSFHRLHDIPVTIIRLFFPYGAGQERGIFPFISKAVREGIALSIQPGGAPKMNPVHMDDIVDAVQRMVDAPDGCRVFNLCGDEPVSFQEAVGLFERKHGRAANVTHVDHAEGDLLGDNTLLKSGLGWRPRHGIDAIPEFVE